MKKRVILFPIFVCLATPFILYLLGSYALQLLENYEKSEEEKVRNWQEKHQPNIEDDVEPSNFDTTKKPYIVNINSSEEKIEWITASTRRPPLSTTTEEGLITTGSPAAPSSVITPITFPTTPFIPTTTASSTTTTTTQPTRVRTWTYPTSRPRPDPYRYPYDQDRASHHYQHQHHHHHHHHHHKSTTTTPSTTTMATTTTGATTTTKEPTRIIVTTARYQTSSNSAVRSSSSNSIYDRITIPAIPATSSYRNPYIRKIEVTSSTYRTPKISPTTSTHHHHQHHHHHTHNRSHIDTHSHHRHHIPYPQFPYPHFPNMLYPTRDKTTTTTTAATTTTSTTTEAPTTGLTKTKTEETTTADSRHHPEHHHHGHHRYYHSSTIRPTTTTSRESELDRWGFVASLEDLSSEEEPISTSSSPTTTTTVSTTTLITEASTSTSETVREKTEAPRSRQPEPTQAPAKRVEREVTLVTGFLDIGRGDWDIYRRPLETYHKFMETLLTLENNFVVFTDESSYDFVIKTRTRLGLLDRTKVNLITLHDLPLYSYINEAKKIINDELNNDTFYRTVADLDMKTHPESISAEYNIVVNSKTHFLHNVTIDNPFNSEHFVWLDAGYGHANENYFPYSYHWRPALPDGKISLIKVTPSFDLLSNYDLKKLYRKNVALLSGGFIAGDKHAIGQLHSIIHRKFIQLIYQNHIDDDQTLLTLAVNSHPHLFNVVLGDWFDAFRLFAADPEIQMG